MPLPDPRTLCPLAAAALMAFSAAPAAALAGEIRVEAPDDIVAPVCFAADTQGHAGAVLIEMIEGDAIQVYGYGNVTTAEGGGWGYVLEAEGGQDRAVLDLRVGVSVDGDQQQTSEQWVFVTGGIVTPLGLYRGAECGPIHSEWLARVSG
ncbi:hypothetical protein SAMN05421538_10585 [Paracoccus isoporae]|uniref:SH3 domain-containing protein n=1 Tax=Paracoccus isoporae TaxID=591205 RepID=A0A1G7BGJ6_9RHOB|nr:hypothetical protein [Paracoccus isoporae]SDE25997.1 hypothetical protein SAMN05421538_10585 [Paracoccus isoporae]